MTTRSSVGRRAGILVAVLLPLILAAGPARASEPPAGGFMAVDAWTNDDGAIDPGDPGDGGSSGPVFDAWGAGSSPDPTEPGWNPDRTSKDVARCIAAAGPGSSTTVTVDTGYPGYVCTFAVLYLNTTGSPVTVELGSVLHDPGLAVDALVEPIRTVPPGETARFDAAVTVDQGAPMGEALSFQIVLTVAGEGCVPLTPEDIPEGAVLVNDSGLCAYFYDAEPGACGPGWSEGAPFAWHLVVTRTGGATGGTLTGVFTDAGDVTTDTPSKVNRSVLHYYLYTPTDDTMVGAYVELDGGRPRRPKLVVSNTCNDPDGFGHVPGDETGTASILTLAGFIVFVLLSAWRSPCARHG